MINYEEIYNDYFYKGEGSYSDEQIDEINQMLNNMTVEELNDFIKYLEKNHLVEAYDDILYIVEFIEYMSFVSNV